MSLGACANALALYAGLRRRGVYTARAGWGGFLLRVGGALLVLAAALWLAQLRIDWTSLQATPWWRAGLLAGVIAGAAAVYFAALFALGFRLNDFRHARRG